MTSPVQSPTWTSRIAGSSRASGGRKEILARDAPQPRPRVRAATPIEDDPRVVAGKRSLRGEAAALRAVKDHKQSLLDEWRATRPDDQKLPRTANTAPPTQP